MKLSRQKQRGERPDLNMAAMIDVVFLLLIFFLVTAFLADSEFRLESDLALAGSSQTPLDLKPAEIEVSVNRNGETIYMVDKRQFTFSGMRDRLTEYVLRNPDMQVSIIGSDDVEYRVMVAIKDLCKSLGIEKTAFVISETS